MERLWVAGMTIRQKAGGFVAGAGILALLAACAQKEVILGGERFPVSVPLEASLPVEGQPDPTAPPAQANASLPISLPAATSGDWSQRAGNARHLMPHAALSATPALAWTAAIGQGSSRKNFIAAAPVVADGRVFTMDAGTLVTATSTAGATLWSADLTADFDKGGGQSGGGLAAAGDSLYVATVYGELVALEAASGMVIWRQRLNAPVSGAPAVDAGIVYVSGHDGSSWAVDAKDGKVIWQVAGVPGLTGYVGTAAPTVGDRSVIFPSSSGFLTSVLKIGSGTKVWQISVAGKRVGRAYAMTYDVTGDAVINGDVVYAGTGSGRTVAMKVSSGEKLWSTGEGAMGPIAVAGGSLFLVNDEAKLVRLDAETGQVIWSVEMPFYMTDKVKKRKGVYAHYGPVLAGGRVMVVSSDGILRVFDPTDGSLTFSAEIPGGAAAQPAVAGGTLYVVGGKGQLLAFR